MDRFKRKERGFDPRVLFFIADSEDCSSLHCGIMVHDACQLLPHKPTS